MSENKMPEKKTFSTALAKVNDTYLAMIERQMEGNHIEFNDYAKRCVMNAIGTINQVLDKAGVGFASPDLDQSNLTTILLNVAHLELNSIAQPSECYFQLRNEKKKVGNEEVWIKKIEMNIQGDGYDAILSRFGRNIQKVYPFWIVRSEDKFSYPKYNGLEYTPPQWEPTGRGEVVRIVYPILHTDKTLHFYIGEREDVLRNLMAHINNNLMNETFGIVENRFKAKPEQLKQINEKKAALKKKAKEIGFDALDDEELAPYISPSWKEDFSRESMIIRKIRNNIVKKIPKDFGSPAIFESFSEASTEGYSDTKRIIVDNTAMQEVHPIEALEGDISPQSVKVDTESGEVIESTIEPQEAKNEALGADVDNREKPKFE